MQTVSLGIDFGTSGARAIALNPTGQILSQSQHKFAPGEVTNPAVWQQVLWQLIDAIDIDLRQRIRRIAINGTSATVLLCNAQGAPLTSALLYNDTSARPALSAVQSLAPVGSPAASVTSSFAKALWWHRTLAPALHDQVAYLAHQADWLGGLLHGQRGVSDYHNALKLGYDVRTLSYPDWLARSPIADWLPTVKVPGAAIAPILPALSDRFNLPKDCQICAGTTDSIAAFLASGAHQAGDAVTSLGSTLVLKLLSPTPVENQSFGVYSHRLGDLWLAGGASNTGGAVLQSFFSSSQLADLSRQIDTSSPSPFDYYPLNSPGERFPINDPDYAPRLSPRPADDVAFLYGLLDAIARIESEGYQKLTALGAPRLNRVYTAGGGAQNITWQTIRQSKLSVSVTAAEHTEAAYGSALLALRGLELYKSAP